MEVSSETADQMASARTAGVDGGGGSECLQKFRLYETGSKFYLVGSDKNKIQWRMLMINRLEPSELDVHEDPTTYTSGECYDLLKRIHEGNISIGGLKFVTKCYGIAGFVKFLGPYYMLLITRRRKIGDICGHAIYAVSRSEMIPIPNSTAQSNIKFSKDENRYKRLLCTVDLTKDFFFSYSYNIMRSLQKNLHDDETEQVLYETMSVWNEFLTRGVRNLLNNTMWTVALVHGFFKQGQLSVSGRNFKLTLIARRSRHFAGTRYLKRGVNEKGRVANDVETEQIVCEDTAEEFPPEITSVVQNRGSIPLFWSQETSKINIRPDIILHKKDENIEATRHHFENLVKRYGNPIIILNLIKSCEKKPRETLLRSEFGIAIEFINKNLPEDKHLMFLHWDIQKHSRSKRENVLELLQKVAAYALDLTGFFYYQLTPSLRSQDAGTLSDYMRDDYEEILCTSQDGSACLGYAKDEGENSNIFGSGYSGYITEQIDDNLVDEVSNHDISKTECCRLNTDNLTKLPKFQRGVLRTNCIDCLDRTNVAQYAYGLAALGHQLHALGFMDTPEVDLDSPLADDLMEFYERMGDTLALQYGGSAAHNKIFSERRGQWKAATQSQELLRTLQRYYSNAYMDADKQDAINLFLGHLQSQLGNSALWELDSDELYNIGRRHTFSQENTRSLIKRSLSDGNILCESQTPDSSSELPESSVKGLSDSTPEISSSETEISYSRYTPTTPSRQFFTDNVHSCLSNHKFCLATCSNFLDFDLISSGNSCNEGYERSSPVNSPTSSHTEDTVDEEDAAGGGHKRRENTKVSEYSDGFVQWVANGGTFCH